MRTFDALRLTGRLASLLFASSALLLSVACAASPTGPSAGGTSDSAWNGNLNSSLSYCTEEINKYRATVNLEPLGRASDLEDFAAHAAEYDGKTGVPHQYLKMTNGGGVARAENQLLLWKGYAVNEVIRQGLAVMWAEGPTGSHYQTLTGNFSQVGCGIYMNGNEVNVSQDFR